MAQENREPGFYKKYFRDIDVVHGLQSKPEDRDWLLTTPEDDVKPSDIVLYLGCNVLRTTHLIRTVTDIFKLMGVNYAAVGGKTYCCGIQHFQRGDEDSGRAVAATTAANFQKFNPKKVVMWCPSCIYFYDDIMDMRQKSFDFNHVTQFLVDNLDKLDLKPQPETTVALHYHTGREQSDAEADSAKLLLSKLPGVTVVDVGTDARFGRHCTPAVRDRMGADEWESMATGFVEQAIDKGVDTFTTLYHGCQRHMCRYEADYPVKVEHYLTVIGRALGIEHEDLHKKHVLSGDVDAIMEETSPCSIASGISPEEARQAIERNYAKR
ncbi:MAG: heterodisulfide reductase-related iron-sulfur binding cluster [Chloroflexi bacterium]|nr:heterodisulfide reductase-related iron-sulfur binding cluster [Chloroflexota bacterium]MDA1271661.1 heterodisulfide reductase-related iron-sulfur binding cluster [Chloroflexota bacterium]